MGSADGKKRGTGVSMCSGLGDASDTDPGSRLQRSCSNCGNSFCSRCCSFKVPKSSMGATGEWCKQPRDQGSGRAWLVPTSSQEVLPKDRSEGSVRGQNNLGS